MIYQQAQHGEAVAILTIFAASPPSDHRLSRFAQRLHDRWRASAPPGLDFSDPPAMRRAEDLQAIAALSPAIRVIHFDLPDCIYRTEPSTDQALYDSEAAIFGAIHPADPALAALSRVPPLPAGARLVVPLGAGHHVDHQIVRQAVESWKLAPERICYYEDYPYAADARTVEAALGDRHGWKSIVTALDEVALAAKIRAVAAYESQISTFWKSPEAMSNALRRHLSQVGGERVWIRTESSAQQI